MHQLPCTTLADFEELASNPCPRLESMMPAGEWHRRIPRKWWEYNFLANCMERCVGFDEKASALGLGVGMEALIFYFARGCKEILATDLYSSSSEWKEARLDDPSVVHSKSPIEYDLRRLRVQSADMRHVGVADASYDFVWSCSSIEHVPTLRDLHATFQEIHRVLRVGGYAFLTTEYCLTQGPYLLPSLNCMDKDLFPRLVGGLGGLELVGPTHLDYNWGCPANHAMNRHYLPPGFQHKDVPLQELSGPQVARYGGISQITPIGFVLRKTSDGRPIAPWDALDLRPEIRDYTHMLDAMAQGDFESALEIGQPYCQGDQGADLSPQFRLHWLRLFIEAMARSRKVSACSRLDQWLDRMARMLPEGELQDADCFDLHTYLCGDLRKYDLAIEILPRIIRSPSTLAGHALKLACRLLTYSRLAGRFELALDVLREQWADLAAHASVTPAAVQDFLDAFSQADLPERERKLALHAVREALAPFPESLESVDRLLPGMNASVGWRKNIISRLGRFFR